MYEIIQTKIINVKVTGGVCYVFAPKPLNQIWWNLVQRPDDLEEGYKDTFVTQINVIWGEIGYESLYREPTISQVCSTEGYPKYLFNADEVADIS